MNDKGEHSNVWPADAVEAPKLPAGNDMSPTPIANEQLFQFPPDGKLASGGSTATPAFSKLDDEKQNTYNNPMSAGPHQFKWHLPAKHRTTYFTYYITKPDWQSVPGADSHLTRAMFEDKPFCHKVYTYAPATRRPIFRSRQASKPTPATYRSVKVSRKFMPSGACAIPITHFIR